MPGFANHSVVEIIVGHAWAAVLTLWVAVLTKGQTPFRCGFTCVLKGRGGEAYLVVPQDAYTIAYQRVYFLPVVSPQP